MNRRAFSFAEVMFAVVILGVGFIMVAAIFPMAAEQTRNTADEAVAAQLARNAVAVIEHSTSASDYVAASADQTFTNVWQEVSSGAIDPADARYAWVPFFSTMDHGLYRVSILVVRRQIHDAYQPADTSMALLPRNISLGNGSGDGIVRLLNGTWVVYVLHDSAMNINGYVGNYQCVTPGTFLIIGTGDTNVTGKAVRVGQILESNRDFDTYQLDPTEGLGAGEYCNAGTAASAIGRDYADLSNPASGYAGPAQDVAVYTTFVKLN